MWTFDADFHSVLHPPSFFFALVSRMIRGQNDTHQCHEKKAWQGFFYPRVPRDLRISIAKTFAHTHSQVIKLFRDILGEHSLKSFVERH